MNNSSTKAVIIQDIFLNQIRKDQTKVNISMSDGNEIGGIVKGFDPFTIILEDGNDQYMLYKHSITRVKPESQVLFVQSNNNTRR